MSKSFCIAVVLGILTLSGCATSRLNIQPIMESNQSPEASSGYLAGMFSQDWDPNKLGFGLGIVNVETAEEYVMPFGLETGLPGNTTDAFGIIQLPPAEYRIAYWLVYSSNGQEIISQTTISPDSTIGLPFTLAPGEVVFIGSHVARYERDADGNKAWFVHHQQLNLQSAKKALSKGYPLFSTVPLSCLGCIN
jgi:hypothetical protein